MRPPPKKKKDNNIFLENMHHNQDAEPLNYQ